MAAQGTFTAQVSSWVRKSQQRIDAVFKESAQRVFDEVTTTRSEGGNLPIDTGFLRWSFSAAVNKLPTHRITDNPNGVQYSDRRDEYVLVIAGAQVGKDIIYATFGANYAIHMEAKYGFVRLAAQRWPTIVASVARQAKARSSSRRRR